MKIKNHTGLKAQNKPIASGMFKTYQANGSSIANEAMFLSDSVIYLKTTEYPAYFEYNYTGYPDNHLKLDGLPMHGYSSQFDTDLAYLYEFSPAQYQFEFSTDSNCLYDVPTMFIDTVSFTPTLIKFNNLSPSLDNSCEPLSSINSSIFSIYPNPTNHSLHLEFSEEMNQKHIKVLDASGREVFELLTHDKHVWLDMKSLRLSGMIFIQVTVGDESEHFKALVKE